MLMMVLALVQWWYTAGWLELADKVGKRVGSLLESFSVASLLRTLFDPYRQISAGGGQGPLMAQLQAWGDRLFSRFFGALVRSMFIVIGTFVALGGGIVGLIQVALWPLVPLLPLIGLALTLTGWKL